MSSTTHVQESARLHSLDSLRASMMALGIVFHGAITYTTVPIPVWPFKDRFTSPVCDVILFFTHSFRMPLFFLLAGFFANLLWQRVGLRRFMLHRAKRILLPFLAGWTLLFLPVTTGMIYGRSSLAPHPWEAVRHYLNSRAYLHHLTTMHLWFLYYLLYFYIGTLVIKWLSDTVLRASLRARVESAFRTLASSPWRPLIFAAPTCFALSFMRTGGFDTETSFLIRPATLAGYGIFFGFGWLLFGQKDLLPGFQRHAWLYVLVAFVLLPLNLKAGLEITRKSDAHTIAIVTGSLICWLLVFGFLGLAQRYLNGGSARVRYLADASYWMYLIHLPIVIWVQIALVPLNTPALLKFLVVVVVTTAITLSSYELFVRHTFIGHVLNGKRPARGQPLEPIVQVATA